MAGPGKGILAILASGKGKSPASDDEGDEGEGDLGKRASQDALDAITAGDAAGLYDALERVFRACQSSGSEEGM